MHLIKDKEWAPEYPVVEWKNGVYIKEKGSYVRDYPITKRICRMCKKPFLRKELPPHFKKNMDAIFGKDICLNCTYEWIVQVFEFLPIMDRTKGSDVRKALDDEGCFNLK